MNCAVCGKPATKYNSQKQPVCGVHAKAKAKAPECPDCGLPMVARLGKYGSFWGCMAFPSCSGIRKI
ncbi:MAG TPA: topoisomerase DNA-binding C4 zinc finger domain-containing protein [archaeon]|nr:topoisomerase DNA-binding C4 zinc finger domain-containing protein [archaeon]